MNSGKQTGLGWVDSVDHSKESEFDLKSGGKPAEAFEWRNNTMVLYFSSLAWTSSWRMDDCGAGVELGGAGAVI